MEKDAGRQEWRSTREAWERRKINELKEQNELLQNRIDSLSARIGE